MNAIIYCRVSSKEQTEGTSLETQEAACAEFARTKGITVARTFIEQGESAKFADRTQLLELIEYCRLNKGRIQMLLVWKVDRFARNVTDHFNVKATLVKYGVRIVSVTEPIDTNPEGRLMETILAGFAQFDNDVRAMRTVQGMKRKVQEGIFPWKAPLGYKSTTAGEKKTRPDQPDQPLFGLLQKAWQEFATGAYTKAEMRRKMSISGVLTHAGKPLSNQSIDNLFGNPFYAGIVLDPWSGEEHQGLHVPMVSRESFARVQQIIGKRDRSIPHYRHRIEFPLRGLVRCDACGYYLTGSFSRGRSRKYPYYHCHNKKCDRSGKGLPVDGVDREFISYLHRIAPKPELISTLAKMIIKTAEDRRSSATSRRSRMRSTINRLDREMQELIRMKTQNLISLDEFQSYRGQLLVQRAASDVQAVPNRQDPEEIRQKVKDITQPLDQLEDTWHDLPIVRRQRFQRLIFPLGFVAGNIRTAQLGLLFTMNGEFAPNESSLVPLTGERWNRIVAEILDIWKALKGPEERKRVVYRPVRRRNRRVASW